MDDPCLSQSLHWKLQNNFDVIIQWLPSTLFGGLHNNFLLNFLVLNI